MEEDRVQSVQTVRCKLPDFWPSDISIWFKQCEAQFRLSKVVAQQTKFDYIIQKLDNDTVKRVRDLIECPPETEQYNKLRDRLLSCFKKSQYEQLQDFSNVPALGDRRPSELMDDLLSAIPSIPHTGEALPFISFAFLHRLPDSLRSLVLAMEIKHDPRVLAEQADRLWLAAGGAATYVACSSAPFVSSLPVDTSGALPAELEQVSVSAVRQQNKRQPRQVPTQVAVNGQV